MSRRNKIELNLRKVRSALTNGSSILNDVDHRTQWMRRFRDLLQAHTADLGGSELLSEGQRSMLRRAAMLEIQLEMLEQQFAANDGIASAKALDLYARTSGNLRRLIESLGLNMGRRPKDVTTIESDQQRLNRILDLAAEEVSP
jgi:hypothetical protein